MKMLRSMMGLVIAFIVAGLIFTRAHAESCQGRIGTETNILGKTDYDPYSAIDLTDSHRISVRNSGTAPCSFALIFRSRAAAPELGGQVRYWLADGVHASLLTNVRAEAAPAARSHGPIPASEAAYIDYQLKIPRGQFAAPGPIADSVELELYALDDSGKLITPALQITTLSINYSVARVMSVNIKGTSATTTTLGFGQLSEGLQRSVDIQVRSNAAYQLDVTSDNLGVLALTPQARGQHWFVPYTVMLDRHPLRLKTGASLRELPPSRPERDANHSLEVTIGDATQKRAGRYEDIITIEITGAGL